MRRIQLFFLLMLCVSALMGRDYSQKFGKITNDELNMTVYEQDTAAAAVVIYEKGDLRYIYENTNGEFIVLFELSKKIKILTDDGIHKADITIPYYESTYIKEAISGIEAYSYNMENGKMVKTKLEKKYIFNEKLNNNYRQIKFSIPNVKKGTVIEYSYKRRSNNTYDIPDWNIQDDIPVIESTYDVLIPEYFLFNIDAAKGFERVNVVDTKENQSFILGYYEGRPVNETSSSRSLKFSGKNIPALKSEPYVWCLNDYISGVRFEIRGIQFPGQMYKTYSRSWNDLDKTILEETDFGQNIKMSNPYKDEVKLITSLATSDEEKISLIYSMIKQKIKWNKSYSFMGSNARDAVKNGTGNNAQINMVLLSALKDAGIKAYPVLISRRSMGRLPLTHPSLNMLNTFVVMAEKPDGKYSFMDGSASFAGPDVLPVDLLVDRARIFAPELPGDKWVDLSNLSKNYQMTSRLVTLTDEGMLTCEEKNRYTNQSAFSLKSKYYASKDSVDYVENYANSHNITIENISIGGLENMSNSVTKELTFTKKLESSGDYIYLNPLILVDAATNPFTQSERKLPIEFNYPYGQTTNVVITIPETYQIEELPQMVNLVLDEKKGSFLYIIKQEGNKIQFSYRIQLNQTIFPQSDYDNIREFFGEIAKKNSEFIVLKKI